MGGKPYENLALLYYFCSFAHSKTSPRNCGTDGPQPENEVLLPA